ncbi:MAG: DUF3891 family protein [Thermodesulfobacteriota bacterium]
MIRRDEKDSWILIRQHDHAKLSYQIMEFWGNNLFSALKPKDEVLFAIKEHDCGWIEWDSNPKVNILNGYPMNFMEMNTNDQYGIWSRSFLKHSSRHPYASALIALHFAKFNQKTIDKNPDNQVAIAYRHEFQKFVARMLKINNGNFNSIKIPIDAKINLRMVQAGDLISLALCHGWSSTEISDVPLDYNGKSTNIKITSPDRLCFQISPFPFDKDEISFKIKGMRLTGKKFKNNQEFKKELDSENFENIEFNIMK